MGVKVYKDIGTLKEQNGKLVETENLSADDITKGILSIQEAARNLGRENIPTAEQLAQGLVVDPKEHEDLVAQSLVINEVTNALRIEGIEPDPNLITEGIANGLSSDKIVEKATLNDKGMLSALDEITKELAGSLGSIGKESPLSGLAGMDKSNNPVRGA